MIPYRDESRVRGFPAMTYSLIIVNVLVFVQEISASARGSRQLDIFIHALGVIPYRISHHKQPPAPAPHPE
ncbi:MAG: rhomboid family intramembrane serine protease, partial [Candidatus Eremiobacteraeota bacterium]|nr:rhomboid family intramembrane serine protease [Candidatus Eremiobacteraeota bacterium]